MLFKNKNLLLILISVLFLIMLLAGCNTLSSDKELIKKIATNIQKALEEKDVDLFMENISSNYSDEEGGTYDNHINSLPEQLISQIQDAEDLIGNFPLLKIETKVTIPEADLTILDTLATGKMKIEITLKACVAWVICSDLYHDNIEYNVDFIKEDEDWKIISLAE